MKNATAFWPLFGVAPHTPEAPPESGRGRRGKRASKARGPCRTCGGAIPPWSWAVCMRCHGVAPGKESVARSHDMGSLDYDRREGDGSAMAKRAAKETADAKVAEKKIARLTAKQRRSLLADARRGEHPLPVVEAFLASEAARLN